MIHTKATEGTGDNDEIKELESELDMHETVMTITPHCDGEKSHPFEGYSLSLG